MSSAPEPDGPVGGLEDLLEGVCVVDRELKLVSWNRAAEVITGYAREEVVGRRCPDDLFLAVDVATATAHSVTRQLSDSAGDADRRELDAYLRRKDGSYLPARLRLAPHRDASGQVRVTAYILGQSRTGLPPARRGPDDSGVWTADPATGVAGRRAIETRLRMSLSEMYRADWAFGVILLRVGGLRLVALDRDRAVTDRMLVAVARTLASCLDPKDSLGRWRDDTFLVVCASIGDEELGRLARTLRALAEAAAVPFAAARGDLAVTAAALAATPGMTLAALLRRLEVLTVDDRSAAG